MRRGASLVEVLVAGGLFFLLIAVLWPAFRGLQASEAQLASYTGPQTLLAALRERLDWDLATASPPELARRGGMVREDGTGMDIPVADGRGVRLVAWRFDASRKVVTRDGQPVALEGLEWAYFGMDPERPGLLEVHLRGAGPKGAPARLAFRLRPAAAGLAGWRVSMLP